MARRFVGKKALVTGAATGIGKAIACRLAGEGAAVAINFLATPVEAEGALEEVRAADREAQVDADLHMTVEADVADEAAVKAMFGEVLGRWNGLDILVNNAGIVAASPSHLLAATDFDRTLAVNLRGGFLCAREAVTQFLAGGAGGAIVNISSVYQTIPKPGYLDYAVSKSALEGLTKTLALEYAGDGIRVNGVGPGAIMTPMNAPLQNDPEAQADVESHIPLGRIAEPEEIAAVVAFLASEEASYITGQTIYACGGLTIYPDHREDWSSRRS
jgi:glucose 1-dehydrogenase